MARSSKTSKRNVNSAGWQFPKTYPPVESCEGDVRAWVTKNRSPVYRKRIKRAVEMVKSYRWTLTGKATKLTRQDVDACHRLLDTLTFDANRRTKSDGGAREVLSDITGVAATT